MKKTTRLPFVACALLGLAACGSDRETVYDGATTTPGVEVAPGTLPGDTLGQPDTGTVPGATTGTGTAP